MIKIVNLTPHAVVLCGKKIESTGCARCQTSVEQVGEIDGIRINRRTFGEVEGLPEPAPGVVYIVSALVAQAVAGTRNDCLIVDETIRNAAGQIVGCNALGKI